MNTWTIADDDRNAVIEMAENTILGMTLVTPVEIQAVGGTVHITGVTNGDTAKIECADGDAAIRLAIDIMDSVNTTLEELPPFGLRHTAQIVEVPA